MVFGLAACGASTETPATTPTESGTTTGSDSTVEPIVLKFSDCHNPRHEPCIRLPVISG